MRNVLLLLVITLCLVTPVSARTPSHRTGAASPKKGGTLVVYYFYHVPRCTSCIAIESQTEATLRDQFSKELESGRMQWKTINVGETKNAHFERDYRLESSSVVLVHVVKGKRGAWKLLDKIWDIGLKDKAGVSAYITEEVKAALHRWKLDR